VKSFLYHGISQTDEEEDDVEVEDEIELAAKLAAYMLDPLAAEAAELTATLAPRKKGKRKKRPEHLVLRVTSPHIAAGDYELKVAPWGPIFEGPDFYANETDDGSESFFWPCIPLPMVSTDPPTGCGSPKPSIAHAGSMLEDTPSHNGHWGKDPEDLPVIALIIRGTCVFTDKVELFTWGSPMILIMISGFI
jgi:hypothetical protein